MLSNNHLWTSGGTGTHAAAIRGALRAESPDLLTVILPQTRQKQPNEVRELLAKVQNVIELGSPRAEQRAGNRSQCMHGLSRASPCTSWCLRCLR